MHARVCQNEMNMATDTARELWHKRPCHMSQKGMHMLVERDFLPKVKNVQLEKCTDCLAGKQNMATFFPRPLMRRKNTLELVHTNVF